MATNPKVDKGSASIVFFYMGDSPFTTLFQESTKLKKAMEGYKKVILLKHNQTDSWLDFSEADEKIADKIVTPTKANLFKYIIDLSKEGYYLDIWIWSHGWKEGFRCSTGTFGSKGEITNNDINTDLDDSKTGLSMLPIRMVYQINCVGQSLNNNWVSVGAKVSIGTRYTNFYPTQFGKFADEWNKGNVSIKSALKTSNTSASRTLVQTYLAMVHAPANNKHWGKCKLGQTVLGDSDCAKEYFTWKWLSNSQWQSGKSGKDNMNYSSTWRTDGDSSITKNTKPSWKSIPAGAIAVGH
jgi:hypothetical protein